MSRLDDDAPSGIDATEAGDVLRGHERRAFDDPGHDPAPPKGPHEANSPRQTPAMAASRHSSSVPNQPSMPRIAGREWTCLALSVANTRVPSGAARDLAGPESGSTWPPAFRMVRTD